MSKENRSENYSTRMLDAHTLLSGLTVTVQPSCCSSDTMIGGRLRTLRKGKKLSIRSLAEKCGISANTLSLIENDRTSPSLHTLDLLSRGLEVPLVAFFEAEKLEPDLVYQQQGQRSQLRFACGTLENLGEGLSPLGAEPILVTLDADQTEVPDISHVGREFIFCLEGTASCIIASKEYRLSPGDSLLFDASIPHRWQNLLSVPSRLLVLFCPMESHDKPAERHLG